MPSSFSRAAVLSALTVVTPPRHHDLSPLRRSHSFRLAKNTLLNVLLHHKPLGVQSRANLGFEVGFLNPARQVFAFLPEWIGTPFLTMFSFV